jgi:hypothetical protein
MRRAKGECRPVRLGGLPQIGPPQVLLDIVGIAAI